MPNYHALSKTTHGNKRWLRATSYAFAMRDGILPLGLGELSKAILTLPVAFVQQESRFHPVAVMSLQPDRNHYVTQDGRWLHGYIPTASRAYPFRLFDTPAGETVLAVDEDSGLVTDGPEGEPFFDEAGEPSVALQEVLKFLGMNAQSMKAAEQATEVLNRHQLIKPWKITIKGEDGDRNIAGLFQIDENALNALSAGALLELRNAGALVLAYCQLLSMQHLPFLGELAKAHAQAEQAATEAAKKIETNGELNLEFLNSGDSINFGGFR